MSEEIPHIASEAQLHLARETREAFGFLISNRELLDRGPLSLGVPQATLTVGWAGFISKVQSLESRIRKYEAAREQTFEGAPLSD